MGHRPREGQVRGTGKRKRLDRKRDERWRRKGNGRREREGRLLNAVVFKSQRLCFVGIRTPDGRTGGWAISAGDERCTGTYYRSFVDDTRRRRRTTNDWRLARSFQPGLPWTRRTRWKSARLLRLRSSCRPVHESQSALRRNVVQGGLKTDSFQIS